MLGIVLKFYLPTPTHLDSTREKFQGPFHSSQITLHYYVGDIGTALGADEPHAKVRTTWAGLIDSSIIVIDQCFKSIRT